MKGQTTWGALVLVLAGPVLGCGDDGASGSGGGGAGSGGASSFATCPDPADPDVDYLSQDPNACQGVDLGCADDEFGFFNGCGCGCIVKGGLDCPGVDNPDIVWVATDPARCASNPPQCELGYAGFSNTCGCGCVPR